MSQENVERVRAALLLVEREGPEAILGNLDPDIEWIADRSDMGQVVCWGHEGVVRSFAELSEGFEDFGFETDRLIDPVTAS